LWILSLVLLLFSWGCISKNNILVERLLIKTEHLQSRIENVEDQNSRIEKELHMLAVTNGSFDERLTILLEAMGAHKHRQENDWSTLMKYIERLHEKNEEFTRILAEKLPKRNIDMTTGVTQEGADQEGADQEGVDQELLLLSSGTSRSDDVQDKQKVTDILLQVARLLSKIDREKLTKEQGATFSMIRGFVSKAKEAFDKKELSKALNLGDKAHTLANELRSVAQE
jgi:hypothetical protein